MYSAFALLTCAWCMYLIIRIYTASCIFPSAIHKYHQISTFKESSIVLIDFYSLLYHSVMCDLFFYLKLGLSNCWDL